LRERVLRDKSHPRYHQARHARPAPRHTYPQRAGPADQNPQTQPATARGTAGPAGLTWVCLTHDG